MLVAVHELRPAGAGALVRDEEHRAGLEAGADAYLTKQGLDARELVALVYRVAGDG